MQAACFSPRSHGIGLRLEIAFCESGIDIAGTDGMHTHALPAMIDGHCLSQPDDCCLSGAVAGTGWLHKKAVHRGKIDDYAASLSEMRKKSARTEEHATHIHSHLPVPFFRRGIHHGFVDLDCGIVHEDMELSKHLDDPFPKLLDGVRVRNISCEGDGLTALIT